MAAFPFDFCSASSGMYAISFARVEQRVPSDGVVGHGTMRVDDGWCGGQWTMAGRRRVELQVGGVVAAVADDVRVGGKQLGACAI